MLKAFKLYLGLSQVLVGCIFYGYLLDPVPLKYTPSGIEGLNVHEKVI